MLNLKLGKLAKRFLKKCEKVLYQRLMDKIKALAADPFPSEVVRVKSKKKEKIFRVRVGAYRIQYVVFHEQNILLVTDVDKRPRAYN